MLHPITILTPRFVALANLCNYWSGEKRVPLLSTYLFASSILSSLMIISKVLFLFFAIIPLEFQMDPMVEVVLAFVLRPLILVQKDISF